MKRAIVYGTNNLNGKQCFNVLFKELLFIISFLPSIVINTEQTRYAIRIDITTFGIAR